MPEITWAQKRALTTLLDLHERYPQYSNFPTSMIGVGGSASAKLRKLEPAGLVKVDRGHGKPGTRFFYSITDAGRAALPPSPKSGKAGTSNPDLIAKETKP